MGEHQRGGIVDIATDGISVGIDPMGAELHYLRDHAGRDLQWSGDPAVWAGRAPILFPIIGALAGNQYRIGDHRYTLGKHGFARRSRFALVDRDAASATFRLDADDATRAVYPFDFRLDIRFSVRDAALAIEATVENRGDAPMPASFGFHPALRWPLPYGEPRADHRIRFAQAEPAPIRRIDAAGLVLPDALPTPIAGDTLRLDDALFVNDAIILDAPASRSVQYGAPAGPQLRVDFPDMPMLGIWTKPGADYICIEPWHGIADPVGFDGDIFAKPGIVIFARGTSRRFTIGIAIEG